MKLTFEIDFSDLMKNLKSVKLTSEILAELNPDEADILDYMPIEQLVQLAYDEDTDQVKENLCKILDISSTIEEAFRQYDFTHIIKKMQSINESALKRVIRELNILEFMPVPEGMLQLSTFIRIAFKENDAHEFMETIKSALRNEVTILYEVK